MDVEKLTRALVDIESITGGEGPVAHFLADALASAGFPVRLQEARPGRFNVFAAEGTPEVVLSSHLDTVPPFIPSREDEHFIYGRGACDAKGAIAAQVVAAAGLAPELRRRVALLYVVGEEQGSAGARAAGQLGVRAKYLINGEPTENRLVRGCKGALRVELLARGRAAHSAYPEEGESAIEKLIDALVALRALPLPQHPLLGRTTWNVGVLEGGVRANVVPASARAEILFRTVENTSGLLRSLSDQVGDRVKIQVLQDVPPALLATLDGFASSVVAFTTDIPYLTGWGKPLLLGPGSIRDAHTDGEKIAKAELHRAVELYRRLAIRLLQVELQVREEPGILESESL